MRLCARNQGIPMCFFDVSAPRARVPLRRSVCKRACIRLPLRLGSRKPRDSLAPDCISQRCRARGQGSSLNEGERRGEGGAGGRPSEKLAATDPRRRGDDRRVFQSTAPRTVCHKRSTTASADTSLRVEGRANALDDRACPRLACYSRARWTGPKESASVCPVSTCQHPPPGARDGQESAQVSHDGLRQRQDNPGTARNALRRP